MENQLLTLSKIFSERLFRIPDYQRGYAWTQKQLNDFWNDLAQIKEKENHYTGVLTLEEVPEEIYKKWDNDFWIINSRSYTPYYVVDGQQRLTTSIILIQCILENIEDDEQLNFTNKEDIIKKYIFDSKDRKITRSYIFGYENDNPSYEFLITKIFCEKNSENHNKDTIYTQNLLYAKNFFSEKIKTLEITEIEILFKKVTQHLLFNNFTISTDVDVCVAFETMNNRGKPLSYLELLKNRLIYLSLKLEEDEDDKKKLRKVINDCWKSIYHNLGRNKDKPLDDDLFLKYHYLIHFGEKFIIDHEGAIYFGMPRVNSRGDFHTHGLLEEKFISKNLYLNNKDPEKLTLTYIYQYTQSLQESVETWYNIWNPFDSKYNDEEKIYLDKINRLPVSHFLALTLYFLQINQNQNERIEFLKLIEKYNFVLAITDRYVIRNYTKYRTVQAMEITLTTNYRKNIISSEDILNTLRESLNKIKNEILLPVLKQSFKNSNFYEWDLIRYFLYEYNLSLQVQSKADRKKINWNEFNENYYEDFITIEHIYPQNARSSAWPEFNSYNAKQKKLIRNSLGNLLPLSQPKNSSLSNKPFKEKVDSINQSFVSYRYGCYAENEISTYNDWTPEDILNRGLQLLSFMEKRWSLKLGSKEDKISILGLDFLNKNSTNNNS